MNEVVFAEPLFVHLLWIGAAVVGFLAFLELRSRDSLTRLVSTTMQARLAIGPNLTRRVAKLTVIAAMLVFGILALMRPQTPGGVETRSQTIRSDIIVALDVSRSMLAEDAAPNRLARAKAEIVELIERVQDHRVGLVAFAGRASVKSPLTTDYGFFRMALRNVDTQSVGRGGTRIGDAVRKAVAAFGDNRSAPRVLLLITDGEDHDSYPLDAVEQAVAAGIRIVTIGFGSEAGSTIMVTDPETGARRVLTDNDGNVVQSRLDGALLREIALASDGAFVPAGTSAVDLDSIVEAHIEPIVAAQSARVERRNPAEHYPWLVLAALIALIGAVWIGAGASRAQIADDAANAPASPAPAAGQS